MNTVCYQGDLLFLLSSSDPFLNAFISETVIIRKKKIYNWST